MYDGIEIEGLDELTDFLADMTIDEADENKAMRKAIEPIYEEVVKNSPSDMGYLRRNIKKQVKKEDLSTVGIVKLGAWYSMFNEFGTSKNKSHIGFFNRAVEKSKDESLEILKKELLDKAK